MHFVIFFMLVVARSIEHHSNRKNIILEICNLAAVILYQAVILKAYFLIVEINAAEDRGCNPFSFGSTKQWFLLEIMAFYINIVTLFFKLALANVLRFFGVQVSKNRMKVTQEQVIR